MELRKRFLATSLFAATAAGFAACSAGDAPPQEIDGGVSEALPAEGGFAGTEDADSYDGGGGVAHDAGQDAGAFKAGPPEDDGSAGESGDGSTDANDATDSSLDASDAGVIVHFVPGVTVSTLAGSSIAGELDGQGTAAHFANPTGVALDAQGNILVADYDGARIRRVTPAGLVTTVASAHGFVGSFNVVFARDGTLYAQTDFDSTGTKNSTSGTLWRVLPLTDGGIATPSVVASGFGRPRGLAPLDAGDLFVADRINATVQGLDVIHGTPWAIGGLSDHPGFQDGTGTNARFSGPVGAAALPDGSFVVADTQNHRIRRVTLDGNVSTFAGNGVATTVDGSANHASFNLPQAICTDGQGNVYVTDVGDRRIRRIDPSGVVETVAGDGMASFRDGAGSSAEFYGEEGIAASADGKSLYVADGSGGTTAPYNRLRAISIP